MLGESHIVPSEMPYNKVSAAHLSYTMNDDACEPMLRYGTHNRITSRNWNDSKSHQVIRFNPI